MTKAELVAEISTKTGIEKNVVLQVVEANMKVIKTMISGENVYLRGFGSFIVKHRAKKIGRIISKNTAIVIPAHHIPAFKPAKTFSARLKNVKPKAKQSSESVD
jgi:DNA-binding protein HU-beta